MQARAVLLLAILLSGNSVSAEQYNLTCRNTESGDETALTLTSGSMTAQFGSGNPGKILFWGEDNIRWATVSESSVVAFIFQQSTYRIIADGVMTNHFDYLDQLNNIGIKQVVLPKQIYQCRRN
jgi:hypothetical protein